jgi:hypothetical protein
LPSQDCGRPFYTLNANENADEKFELSTLDVDERHFSTLSALAASS